MESDLQGTIVPLISCSPSSSSTKSPSFRACFLRKTAGFIGNQLKSDRKCFLIESRFCRKKKSQCYFSDKILFKHFPDFRDNCSFIILPVQFCKAPHQFYISCNKSHVSSRNDSRFKRIKPQFVGIRARSAASDERRNYQNRNIPANCLFYCRQIPAWNISSSKRFKDKPLNALCFNQVIKHFRANSRVYFYT